MTYEVLAPTSVFGPGEFVMFYLVYERYQQQFVWLNHHLQLLQEDLPAVESYMEFMSTPAEVVSGKETVSSLEEDIELENVHFAYPTRIEEKSILWTRPQNTAQEDDCHCGGLWKWKDHHS